MEATLATHLKLLRIKPLFLGLFVTSPMRQPQANRSTRLRRWCLSLRIILLLSIFQPSHPSQGSDNALLGKDKASRSPHTLTPLLLHNLIDRHRATSTSKPTSKATFVPHKYGGMYTQEEIDDAFEYSKGVLIPRNTQP